MMRLVNLAKTNAYNNTIILPDEAFNKISKFNNNGCSYMTDLSIDVSDLSNR